MRLRKDAWTEEEDMYLKETVLRHKRQKKKLSEAYRKVGKKIKRSPGACAFRWSKVLNEYSKKKVVTLTPVEETISAPTIQFELEVEQSHPTGPSYEELKEMYLNLQLENRKLLDDNIRVIKENSEIKEKLSSLFFSI